MKTEFLGTVFYDDTCRFCTESINRLRPWLEPKGFVVAPFENGAAEEEMLYRDAEAREWRGADALLRCAKAFWWARPAAWVGGLPGIRTGLAWAYRQVASRRHCLSGACRIQRPETVKTHVALWWGLALGAVGLAFFLARLLEPWLAMWVLGLGLFEGFKLLAIGALPNVARPRGRGLVAFLFLWPGMEAAAFGPRGRERAAPMPFPWWGLARLGIGAGLLLAGAKVTDEPVWRGIMGMAGVLLMLHFGLFDLFTWFWRGRGREVRTVMAAPWKAETLDEFWGRRWNRAFSDVARNVFFRPALRRGGAIAGVAAAFLLSGLAHEWVISLPAGAGWGMPTAYFVIQGLGLLIERRLTLKGLPGRAWTWLWVFLPLPLLFPPVFFERCLAPLVDWMAW